MGINQNETVGPMNFPRHFPEGEQQVLAAYGEDFRRVFNDGTEEQKGVGRITFFNDCVMRIFEKAVKQANPEDQEAINKAIAALKEELVGKVFIGKPQEE